MVLPVAELQAWTATLGYLRPAAGRFNSRCRPRAVHESAITTEWTGRAAACTHTLAHTHSRKAKRPRSNSVVGTHDVMRCGRGEPMPAPAGDSCRVYGDPR